VAKHGAAKRASEERLEREAGARGRTLRSVDGAASGAGDEAAEEGALALDRLIHERMRLGIVSALAVNDSLTFNDLKQLMHTTDGNLSVHARKLEDAKYISCTKSFEGRVPRTEYKLTTAGRRALERYLDHMEALIRATRER
jgi:DNA-binding MarR family transcriptional regulator